MPTYQLAPSSAVQISQAATDRSLITNTGPGRVYLDSQTSVSPSNASLMLEAGQSFNYSGGPLWAIADAPGATITQMIGGDTTVSPNVIVTAPVTVTGNVGVSGPVTVTGNVGVSGPVTASVTGNIVVDSGTVTVGGILTPVEIQGGGEYIGQYVYNVSPTPTAYNIPVTTPGGKIFPSVLVEIGLSAPATPGTVARLRFYAGSIPIASTSVRLTNYGTEKYFGQTEFHRFLLPQLSPDLTFDITTLVGSFTGALTVNVYGSSALITQPTTLKVDIGSVVGVSGDRIHIPPSFQPYILEQIVFANTGLSCAYREYRPADQLVSQRVGYTRYVTQADSASGYSVDRVIGGNGFAASLEVAVTTGTPVYNLTHKE